MKNFNKLYPGPNNGGGISDDIGNGSTMSNNFITAGVPMGGAPTSSSFNH